MAQATLLVLLDDIATLLEDVATLSNVAAKKTAGILGDDLALNAQQVSGLRPARELPVIWAVAKGSLRNKLMLVPGALLVSHLMPWLISPLLMAGGAYLCFEGCETILRWLHTRHSQVKSLPPEVSATPLAGAAYEAERIKGAIRTDLVLSAEIIVITLGIVAAAPFAQKAIVLSVTAVLMTVVVYGLVAAILKLDDMGLHLMAQTGRSAYARFQRALGAKLLAFAPLLMRSLSVIGTAAMFMVGGGIIAHGIAPVQQFSAHLSALSAELHLVGGVLAVLGPVLLNGLIGVISGALCVALFNLRKTLSNLKP